MPIIYKTRRRYGIKKYPSEPSGFFVIFVRPIRVLTDVTRILFIYNIIYSKILYSHRARQACI